MASLYDIVPGIQVTSDDILEAELLAVQILQSKYPDTDVWEGTAIRDLVIRPAATLLAMIKKSSEYYFTQNSLINTTDDTDTEIVDSILSNWFVTRHSGTRAIINARLFFARSKAVTLASNTFFSPDNTLKFLPAQTTTYPASALIYDSYSNEYYLDVDLTAAVEGTTYNLSSGSLLYFSNFDPYFLRGQINFLRQESSATETNTQLIARAENEISTRNLINAPSIASNISAAFTQYSNIQAVGNGDPYMIRDMVKVYSDVLSQYVRMHNGGKVDVYVTSALATAVVQVTLDGSGNATLTGPIYSLSRSAISGGAAADTVPFVTSFTVSDPNTITHVSSTATYSAGTLSVPWTDHPLAVGRWVEFYGFTNTAFNGIYKITATSLNSITVAGGTSGMTSSTGAVRAVIPEVDVNFSTRQQRVVSFGSGSAGGTASFSINYFNFLDGLQTYLEDGDRRVLCGDLLARGYNLCKLTVGVTSYEEVSPDQTVCAKAISEYLSSLLPGQPFIMTDAIKKLNDAGVGSIKTPLTITYKWYTRDCISPIQGTITDAFNPLDKTSVFALDSLSVALASL